jgi:hypothetical protein
MRNLLGVTLLILALGGCGAPANQTEVTALKQQIAALEAEARAF